MLNIEINKKIIICTPTYNRENRLLYIKRASEIFNKVENIFWIIVEDANFIDNDVLEILNSTNIKHIYYAYGPTRYYGMKQWNSAMEYINNNKIEGIVYCTGDDNYWDLELFNEIRLTKNISILLSYICLSNLYTR